MASVRKRVWTGPKGDEKEAWVVAYKDGGGKPRLKTFAKKKDADAFRNRISGEVASGLHTPDSSTVTIATLWKEFEALLESRHRDGAGCGRETLYNTKHTMNRYFIPALGMLKVKDCTFNKINEVANNMRLTGLSPKTVQARLYTLRIMFDYAIRHGYTAVNPAIVAIRERGPVPTPVVETFSKAEIARLLECVQEKPFHKSRRTHEQFRLFVHIAAFCGLRLGEINALSVDSIDIQNERIHVSQSITPFNEIKGPKTQAGVRDVPLPKHIAAFLNDWMVTQYKPNPGGYLFLAAIHSSELRRFPVRGPWYALLTKAGMAPTSKGKWRHFHALRHFAASYLIDCGLPVTEVAHLLGHASFDETLRTYAHPLVTVDRQTAAIQTMASALLPAPARQGRDIEAQAYDIIEAS